MGRPDEVRRSAGSRRAPRDRQRAPPQGKTYLLDAVASAVDGFFYSATEDTETDALANFGRALAEWTGGGRYAFASWEEALDLLFTAVTGKLIVIDEFP